MKYLPYVHITQGTASTPRYSNGNTLPLTQLPFGMAAFAPQTGIQDPGWFFHPQDRSLEGVRLTHQPSPWIGDFGALLLMPQSGRAYTAANERWSGYRPEEAVLSPDYMSLRFLRSRAGLELAPSERGAHMRLTFERTGETPYLSVLRVNNDIGFRLDAAGRRLYGHTNSATLFPLDSGFHLYFVLEFDCDIDIAETREDAGEACHVALRAHEVSVRLATSYIGYEQAERNLETELAGRSFEDVRLAAEGRWEELLGRIEIESGSEELLHTFYTCLYRTLLFPNKAYEIDAGGEPVHYDYANRTVNRGVLYTNNGFWDTFRTVYPLLSIVAPEIEREILEGYVQIYRNSGWMPKWPSMRETGVMPGTLIDAVVADAAVKGILTGETLRTAFEGLRKHAEQPGEGEFGRKAVEEYRRLGYVPRYVRESVNCTLDYAYGDFCIARVAELLGETDVMREYDRRAQNYRNLFDPASGFMRSRDADGHMTETFDPYAWGGDYTEGSAWQNSFAVYHDMDGLAALHGGPQKLIGKLDELFAAPPDYQVGGYGFEIHEMSEMAAVDFGQCAISNQPSFHLPYMYAALGDQASTDRWVRKIAEALFSWKPDGLPGDEDNGTTGAWYVFSVMGFYPLCPGKPEYVRGVRLADAVRIHGRPLAPVRERFLRHDELPRPPSEI